MTKYKQKDSFIIHHDTASIFQQLTNEQAGELIKHLIFYSNSLNQNPKEPKKPTGFSSVTSLLAHSFEKQLERDFWKYQTVCQRNENNGKKGGRPPKLDKIKTQKNPKKPDSDSDSDKDSDKEKDASAFSLSQGNCKENLDSSTSAKNAEFEDFWNEYGKKVKKPKAEESFKKALKTKDTTFQSIMNGVKKYNEYLKVATWCPKAHPTTWLNESRWNDDYDDLIKQEYKKNNKTPPVQQKTPEKQQEEVKIKEDTQRKREGVIRHLHGEEVQFMNHIKEVLKTHFDVKLHGGWIDDLLFSCRNKIAYFNFTQQKYIEILSDVQRSQKFTQCVMREITTFEGLNAGKIELKLID